MHYIKQFHINGVDTKQVACIELHGKPNAATEGAVGVLGMDVSSPTHEVYKCVAVNGSVYTWELLSAGMSIMSAKVTGEGALTKSFLYTDLIYADGYLIKSGDLILDSEGYLYRITEIGSDACNTAYCGTHIGGMASGDKDYTITISNGKLQLVTESGAVVGETDALVADDETIYRDETNGKARVIGIKTVNGGVLHIFVGTKADYDALTEDQKQDLFAIITDDSTKDTIMSTLNGFRNGTEAVGKASKVSPVGVETKTYNVTLGTDITLDENSVYLVTIKMADAQYLNHPVTNFILPIGSKDIVGDSTQADKDYRSTIGSGTGDREMWRGRYYYLSNGKGVFFLDKGEFNSTSGFSSYNGGSTLSVTFAKIADYPT